MILFKLLTRSAGRLRQAHLFQTLLVQPILLTLCCLGSLDAAYAETATPLIANETYAPAAEPIRIGVPVSLTGRLADFADQQLKGMELFVDDINNRGALLLTLTG